MRIWPPGHTKADPSQCRRTLRSPLLLLSLLVGLLFSHISMTDTQLNSSEGIGGTGLQPSGDEEGIGGTGRSLERPEMPERPELMQRPDFDAIDSEGIDSSSGDGGFDSGETGGATDQPDTSSDH